MFKLHVFWVAVFILTVTFETAYADDCIKASKLADEAGKLYQSDARAAQTKFDEAIRLCDESAALRYNLAVLYL